MNSTAKMRFKTPTTAGIRSHARSTEGSVKRHTALKYAANTCPLVSPKARMSAISLFFSRIVAVMSCRMSTK